MALSNDNPLVYKDTEVTDWLYRITEKSENEMTLVQINPPSHGAPTFLGAIVSNDRQTVFWVNDTNPLP